MRRTSGSTTLRSVVTVGAPVMVVWITSLSTGCASTPESLPDRIQARRQAAPAIIDDPLRAARAQAAFEGMHEAATKLEDGVAAARAHLLAMHHDPSATHEDFHTAIEAMRDRHQPMLLELIDRRLEAAAATTEREWKRLQKD